MECVTRAPVKPKIILLDIESSPALGYTWGKYEQNVLKFVRDWELLSFAWKELGKRGVKCLARPQFRDKSDKSLVKAVWHVLDSADIVIAHNGDAFDVPKLRAKFIEHGLRPTTPFKTIDTLKIARRQFKFTANSLNDLAGTLRLGNKVSTGGFELWLGCMAGKAGSWRKMIRYNKHDVALLERAYLKLRAWHPSHPNVPLHGEREGCPVCSSTRVQKRGWNVAKTRKTPRYQCLACSHWFSRASFPVTRRSDARRVTPRSAKARHKVAPHSRHRKSVAR